MATQQTTMSKAGAKRLKDRKNQFIGVNRKKPGRRANRPGGTNRKLYPRVRQDQKGTPAAMMIHAKFRDLTEQGNALKDAGLMNDNRMSQEQASGSLATYWDKARNRGTKGRFLSERMSKDGLGMKDAHKKLMGLYICDFGADPKNA